jgi:hypothetical protein
MNLLNRRDFKTGEDLGTRRYTAVCRRTGDLFQRNAFGTLYTSVKLSEDAQVFEGSPVDSFVSRSLTE